MVNPFDISDPQVLRENIVLQALTLDKNDLKQVEDFDKIVCNALGLDAEEEPPNFIFDALSAS